MTQSASHVRVIEETSGYWRVLFDNPPLNLVDATMFEGLIEVQVQKMWIKSSIHLERWLR